MPARERHPRPLVSVDEASVLLGISRASIYSSIEHGDLPLSVFKIKTDRLPRSGAWNISAKGGIRVMASRPTCLGTLTATEDRSDQVADELAFEADEDPGSAPTERDSRPVVDSPDRRSHPARAPRRDRPASRARDRSAAGFCRKRMPVERPWPLPERIAAVDSFEDRQPHASRFRGRSG
jgi:predicted DNA-binding transcriptional regulator AlpA